MSHGYSKKNALPNLQNQAQKEVNRKGTSNVSGAIPPLQQRGSNSQDHLEHQET